MIQLLYILFFIIILADFIFERYLDWLNSNHWSHEMPCEVNGIYKEEVYRKSQLYERAKYNFSKVSGSFSFLLVIILMATGFFGWLDQEVRSFIDHPVWTSMIFFAILALASEFLSLPFSWYGTFVLEEKFGFNKSSHKTFWVDQIKGLLISILLGGTILWIIIRIYIASQSYFWLLAFGVLACFMVLLTLLYSNIIVPLFNKQMPLEEGLLRNQIADFCHRVDFKLDNIYIIDGSKRSSKANAYFTGFGRRKRVVLYDTLVEDLTVDEVIAVLAHEIGHYKRKHVTKGLIISLINLLVTLFVFSLVSRNQLFAQVLGAEQASFHLSVIAFGILFTPLTFLTSIFLNGYSRKNEFEADNFAAVNHSSSHLSSALIKLSVNNLSNLTPHPWYVFFHYSHPPLLQRLNKLQAQKS
jgi:Zn-dependent protease with chaperone function